MTNYYLEFLNITSKIKSENEKPKLLMHSCCAPCSSSSLVAVLPFFKVDLLYYNPNITDKAEYLLRLNEQKTFVEKVHSDVNVIEGEYNPQEFYSAVCGLENLKEGGERCFRCYRLRLLETAKVALERGYDYFASTLTVSPYKRSDELNKIGFEISEEFQIKYLPTDFKKNDGYKRSIELSKEYGLYRQNYCGCEFSKMQAEKARQEKNNNFEQ